MDMKATADVSSYILLEATGDSEADSDPIMYGVAYEIARADDDAQSCSYDGSENCNVGEELNGYESYDSDSDSDYENDDEKKEDEQEADVHGTSYCEDDEMQKHHKSSVSAESGQQLMDEMEKNRQFWEACLAS